MKIAVFGQIKSDNLGDKIISDSLSWIVSDVLKEKKITEKIEFIETDIYARNDILIDYKTKSDEKKLNYYNYDIDLKLADKLYRHFGKISKKFNNMTIKNICYRFRHIIWNNARNYKKRHLDYLETKLKDVDLIIVAGGGLLEYSSNEYQDNLNLITEYGQKYNIPVIFNAIGRAGEFNPNDYRCSVLKNTFQRDCVKYVSARDSRENVQECVGDRFNVKLLADAAFCSEDAYDIHWSAQNSKKIGIGIIRGTALQSYNVSFTTDDWVNLFADIAAELKKRGYDFQFFTNGLRSDYKIGLKLIEKLGLDKSYLVDRPVEAKVLYKTISRYRGLITCRMHSSIVAFSMGIPSVILSWNKKVNKYMEICGYPDRAINIENFNAKYIVDQLELSLKDGISDENHNKMKSLARESVTDYIDYLHK